MKRKFLFLFACFLFCCAYVGAQENSKSAIHQRAEAADGKGNVAEARYSYIRAFEGYAASGQMKTSIECAAKAAALYYKEGYFKEAFDLLRRADETINAKVSGAVNSAPLHYLMSKERLQMYIRMRRSEPAKEHLNLMEQFANTSSDESVKSDFLYNKAIYHYTFGQNAQGNAVFKEMADKLTKSKEYGKVDEVYRALIASARKSGNVNMLAQSYSNYIAWKDSAMQLKHADEIGALKKRIADDEAVIADKDSSLTTRWAIIIALGILAAVLAAVLIAGALVLVRYIFLTRKQKKTIKLANENNALKAKFISNISSQLDPTLQKLDASQPEVKALLDFSQHIQTLSLLENSTDTVELEDVSVPKFCDSIVEQVRPRMSRNVKLTVNAPQMNTKINKEYVSHILVHLLNNAAIYTPQGGSIWLDFKKRGAHTFQFIVSDTGCGIPEEKHEDLFKPFLEVRDLTQGDGLGLPICKQMALKMGGDLDIDPKYTKGARFVLDLKA